MKCWSLLMVAGVVLVVLAGLAGPVPARAQQPIVMKIGNAEPVDNPTQAGQKKFADLVAERTKNQLQVQVFPAGQLGTQQEMLEGVQHGTIHMFEGACGAVGRFLPELEAFAAPYIWRDLDHMLKVVRGPIGQSLADRLVKTMGMRTLDMGWFFGTRQLTTKIKAVHRPEDLKGIKVRVQPVAMYLETLRAMGANPTPLDWKEVYLALQTGVIDGQENPPAMIYTAKLFEVQKYVMLTGHITQSQAIVINEKFYQGLSPEFRKVLLEAAIEAGDFETDLAVKQEKIYLEQLKGKGMTVIQPDVKAFREATKDVYKKFADKWEPHFYERIQEAK
jgi:tripartite ATP-independent transporter DctP family solute receptor